MPNLFGDLSYNKKTLKPIGRPVDDLKELYAKKGEDYNYVIDNMNSTETALNSIPFEDKDRAIVDAAKKKYKDTFDEYSELGDFENRKLDAKKLANYMANKSGLREVQRNSMSRSAMIKELKERVEDGSISKSTYQNAILASDRGYEGVQKDEVSGEYMGKYTPTVVQDDPKAAIMVADALDGWEANTIVLKGRNGEPLIKTEGGTGYLQGETMKYVSEAELREAAIRYVRGEKSIQGQVKQDIGFELGNLLHDKDGVKREMAVTDIQNVISRGGISKSLATRLGLDGSPSLAEIGKSLEGKDLEAVYSQIRDEQMTDDIIALGVSKESFETHSRTYKKDWVQEAAAKKQEVEKAWESTTALFNPYGVQTGVSGEDFTKAAEGYATTMATLPADKAAYAKLQQTGGNPEEQKALGNTIRQKEQAITTMEDRSNKLIAANKEVSSIIANTVNNVSFIPGVDGGGSSGSRQRDNFSTNFSIKGLKINERSMQSLVTRAMAGDIPNEELEKYISLDLQTYVDAEKSRYHRGAVPTEEQITAKAMRTMESEKERQVDKLRNRVESASSKIKEKADKGELAYSKQLNVWSLPEMTAEERRGHPIAQVNNHLASVPTTAKWNEAFTSVGEGTDLGNDLAALNDISEEKGDIKWDKAKLQSTAEVVQDKDGNYVPSILMTVPIKDNELSTGKKTVTKLVDVAVKWNNPSYTKAYVNSMEKYRDRLNEKNAEGGLDSNEREVLDKLNLNIYNLSGNTTAIDGAGLYDGVEGTRKVTWYPGHTSDVTTFVGNSPSNLGMMLTTGEGQNMRFLGTRGQGDMEYYTRAEIADPSKGVSAVGANSVEGLKGVLANIINNHSLDQPKANVNTLRNQYFGGFDPMAAPIVRTPDTEKFLHISKDKQAAMGIEVTLSDRNEIIVKDLINTTNE